MKSLFCFFTAVFFFSSVLNAQTTYGDYVPTPEDIQHFPETKTMIVLEDNPICEYNLTIKDFVASSWKATPYDFLEFKEFEAKKNDKSLSFLILDRVTMPKDKSNTKYLFMSLLLGSDAKKISSLPDMCSVPLAYFGAPEETYAYKVEILLRFMQNHVKLISDDPGLAKKAAKNPVKFYSSNIQPLDGKTLYLIAADLDKEVNTEKKIKAVYDGPFKLVTKEEIQQAIKDKDPNVVFLHKVGPAKKPDDARCYKILIGAADAQLYYFDYHKLSAKAPNGFLAADFKILSPKKKKK